jgi:hypothetical protein
MLTELLKRSQPVKVRKGFLMFARDIYDWLSPFKNPTDSASPYLNQAMGNLPQYFQPYINAGNQAIPSLESQYNSLINNPSGIMNSIGAGYKQSPGYQFQLNQGLAGANNAAAAGGMLGSPQHQQQATQLSSNFANQDYYNYLNHALGLYSGGLGGLGDLYKGGMGASMGLGEDLSSLYGSQAQLAYEGQNAQNQHNGGFLGALLGAGSAFLK